MNFKYGFAFDAQLRCNRRCDQDRIYEVGDIRECGIMICGNSEEEARRTIIGSEMNSGWQVLKLTLVSCNPCEEPKEAEPYFGGAQTGDGVDIIPGMTVWLYPADSIIGGTIESRIAGTIVSRNKVLFEQPDPDGCIGARAGSLFSTREAAEEQRIRDLECEGI